MARETYRVSKTTLAQWHEIEAEVLAISAEHDDCFLHTAFDAWALKQGRSVKDADLTELNNYIHCLDSYGADALVIIE